VDRAGLAVDDGGGIVDRHGAAFGNDASGGPDGAVVRAATQGNADFGPVAEFFTSRAEGENGAFGGDDEGGDPVGFETAALAFKEGGCLGRRGVGYLGEDENNGEEAPQARSMRHPF